MRPPGVDGNPPFQQIERLSQAHFVGGDPPFEDPKIELFSCTRTREALGAIREITTQVSAMKKK